MSEMPQEKRRALILDDNEGNRVLLKFVLEMNHIENREAENAAAALAIWQPKAFSFAFLDIELPDINGIEVARRLRLDDPEIAIIMCSTNDQPQALNAAIQAGCDMFLIKPFQLDTLLNLAKTMDRATLRTSPKVQVIDNRAQSRWEPRAGLTV